MPWTANVSKDLKFVEISASGIISDQDMLESRKSVEQAWHKHGITRVLVDAREVAELPGTSGLFAFGSSVHETPIPPDFRFAVAVGKEVEEDLRFLETVSRNRGVPIRLFPSVNKARDWLES